MSGFFSGLKIRMAIQSISSAIASNFIYKGVTSLSSDLSRTDIFPTHEESPTTIATIFPSPDKTRVPLIIIGEGTSCLPELFLKKRGI